MRVKIEFNDPLYAESIFHQLLNGFPLEEISVEFKFQPARPAEGD